MNVASQVAAVLPRTIADLKELIAIPSISAMPEHAGDVRRADDLIASWLGELGAASVEVVQEGGQPAVIAHFPAPAGQPTVLLYAHSDVQPFGDVSAWSSAPTEAVERGGRLYGRGAADNKNGVAAHLAVLRAFAGKPPVGVTVFIEGEEESGSASLTKIIERHREALAADVFVIADSGNWEVGEPAITNTLRGVGECVVTLRTLAYGVHSGEFGGVVPDALTTLCRLLATLHDDAGNVAVEGLVRTPGPELDYSLERLADETGKLPNTEWIGSGSMVERMWTAPSISVLALDTTRVAEASNTLIPVASAKIGLRVAPGDDAARALRCVVEHLRSHVPWGAELEIADLNSGDPGSIPTDGVAVQAMSEAMRQAWGKEPVFMGTGGSIPMIAEFQRAFPGAEVLCVGTCDPDSRIHGINESLELDDLRKFALAEALLLEKVAKD
ncbi:MAG: dipeptidase [Propionibacteriaceae bacterium]|jgi:acetylornithine deacetylase/succinyl-diaminopimelate desuccinylase-like protein|nr:dipeptidase [Propionibacteriaceae bacterium]